MSAPSSSPLLTLPRELRDEISELLLLPAHVYTSAPAPAHTLHRRMGTDATYLDTRIFLPVRAAPNMLATCRQLRDECLDLVSRRTGPRSGLIRQDLQKRKEEEDTSMVRSWVEETFERGADDGSIRITVEILRETMSTFGFYMPAREEPSLHTSWH